MGRKVKYIKKQKVKASIEYLKIARELSMAKTVDKQEEKQRKLTHLLYIQL